MPISYQLCSFWNQETHPNPRYSANLYWISEGRNEWTEIFRIFKWPDLVFNVVSFDYHIKCLPYVYVLNKTFHIIHLSTIILSIVAIWVYDFKIVVKFNKWLSVKCFWNLQVKKEILEREILEKEILHVERWIVFGENARSLKYEGCVIDFSHGL